MCVCCIKLWPFGILPVKKYKEKYMYSCCFLFVLGCRSTCVPLQGLRVRCCYVQLFSCAMYHHHVCICVSASVKLLRLASNCNAVLLHVKYSVSACLACTLELKLHLHDLFIDISLVIMPVGLQHVH